MTYPIAAEFSVAGEPASKARARFTAYGSKVRTYTPAKTMQAEHAVAAAFRANNDPGQTMQHEATYGVHAHFYCGTGQRRDIDNMLKLILDGLNNVAWHDDVQVIEVSARKSRVPKDDARTQVSIYRIGVIEKPRGKCIRCGGEFDTYASTSTRKFCTRECGYAFRKESRKRTCKECGVPFTHAHPSHTTEFCSIACTSANKRVTLACVECGAAFTKPRSLSGRGRHLCSETCSASHWRKQRTARAKGVCVDCGGATSKKRYERCRGCRLDFLREQRKESA